MHEVQGRIGVPHLWSVFHTPGMNLAPYLLRVTGIANRRVLFVERLAELGEIMVVDFKILDLVWRSIHELLTPRPSLEPVFERASDCIRMVAINCCKLRNKMLMMHCL